MSLLENARVASARLRCVVGGGELTSVEPEGKSEKVEGNGLVWSGGDGRNAANGDIVTRATVQGLLTWLFLGSQPRHDRYQL